MRPYLKKTSWPFWISAPVNTTFPAASTALSGMGGAFVYVKTVTKVRTEKPPIMTRIAACRHHGERPVALPDVSAISFPHLIVSRDLHFRSQVHRTVSIVFLFRRRRRGFRRWAERSSGPSLPLRLR